MKVGYWTYLKKMSDEELKNLFNKLNHYIWENNTEIMHLKSEQELIKNELDSRSPVCPSLYGMTRDSKE